MRRTDRKGAVLITVPKQLNLQHCLNRIFVQPCNQTYTKIIMKRLAVKVESEIGRTLARFHTGRGT